MRDEQIRQLRETLRRAVEGIGNARAGMDAVDRAFAAELDRPPPRFPPAHWICTAHEGRTDSVLLERHEFLDPALAIETYRQILGRREYEGREVRAELYSSGSDAGSAPRYDSAFANPVGMGRIASDDPRLSTKRGHISANNVAWSLPKSRKPRRKAPDPEA